MNTLTPTTDASNAAKSMSPLNSQPFVVEMDGKYINIADINDLETSKRLNVQLLQMYEKARDKSSSLMQQFIDYVEESQKTSDELGMENFDLRQKITSFQSHPADCQGSLDLERLKNKFLHANLADADNHLHVSNETSYDSNKLIEALQSRIENRDETISNLQKQFDNFRDHFNALLEKQRAEYNKNIDMLRRTYEETIAGDTKQILLLTYNDVRTKKIIADKDELIRRLLANQH
jgi:hypothetical protein